MIRATMGVGVHGSSESIGQVRNEGGDHLQTSIQWALFEKVLYNFWFLAATTGAIMLAGKVLGYLTDRLWKGRVSARTPNLAAGRGRP